MCSSHWPLRWLRIPVFIEFARVICDFVEPNGTRAASPCTANKRAPTHHGWGLSSGLWASCAPSETRSCPNSQQNVVPAASAPQSAPLPGGVRLLNGRSLRLVHEPQPGDAFPPVRAHQRTRGRFAFPYTSVVCRQRARRRRARFCAILVLRSLTVSFAGRLKRGREAPLRSDSGSREPVHDESYVGNDASQGHCRQTPALSP